MTTKVGTAVLEIGADLGPLDKGLAQAEKRAQASAAKAGAAVEKETAKAAKSAEKSADDLARNIDRIALVGVAGFAAIGGASVKAAIDFESSFAGVRKTISGTEADFAMLEGAFRDMAKQIPVNVNEINRIGEAAGQLGIKKENIVGFTRVMADLGVATNLTSEQAATSLAKLANITQMPQENFDRLGSTIVALGNNLATTEADIVSMGMRLAGAGAQIGLTEAQILGFAGALSSVGIEAEAGGSAFSKIMIQIAADVESGGGKLETFAKVAGMSADEFSAAWKKDPAAALTAFVTGLGNMESQGMTTLGVLEELGITEVRTRDAMLRLSGAGELVAQSLGIANDAWGENTALTTEAEQRYKTTASQIQIMRNRLNDVAITMGQQFVPAMAGGVGVIGGFADGIAKVPPSTLAMATGLGAITAATPLMIKGLEKGLDFVNSFGAGTASARGKALLFAGSLTAIAVGADLILQKTTGHGLIETLTGDIAKADAGIAAMRELDAIQKSLGENAPKSAAGQQLFAKAVEEANKSQELLNRSLSAGEKAAFGSDGKFFGMTTTLFGYGQGAVDAKIKTEQLTAQVAVAAAEMLRNGASVHELRDAYLQLPVGVLREEFDKVTNVTAAWNLVLDQSVASTQASVRELKEMAGSTTEVAAAVVVAQSPIDAYIASMGSFEETAEGASAQVKALEENLQALTSAFGASHPEVLRLNIANAVLKEELADLEAGSLSYSEKLGMTTEQIKAQIESNDALAGTYTSNQEAVEALLSTIDESPATLGAFVDAMNNAGVAQESQIDSSSMLAQAYNGLARDDIPTAVAAFLSLKETLDPAVWAVVAEALGPRLMGAIQTGVADPTAQASLKGEVEAAIGGAIGAGETAAGGADTVGATIIGEAAAGVNSSAGQLSGATLSAANAAAAVRADGSGALGAAIMTGAAGGVNSNSGVLRSAVASAAQMALNAAKQLLGISSPSKVFHDEVGVMIVRGIVGGIAAEGPEVEREIYRVGVGGVAAGAQAGQDIGDAFTVALAGSLGQASAIMAGIQADMDGALAGFEQGIAERDFAAQFGDLALQFTEAVAAGTEGAGASLITAVQRMIDEAIEAGVPDAQALGDEMIDAIASGLDGNPAGVQAALDAIARMREAMKTATAEVPVDIVSVFDTAFNNAWKQAEMNEQFGSKGTGLVNALNKAITDGSPESAERAADLAFGVVETLDEIFDPEDAASITGAFMAAVTDVIEGEGEAAMGALLAILAQINAAATGKEPAKPKTTKEINDQKVADVAALGALATESRLSIGEKAALASVFGLSLEEALKLSKSQVGDLYDDIKNPAAFFNMNILRVMKTYDIPQLKSGLDYVPHDMLAFIHKGEAVVPAHENGRGAVNVTVNADGLDVRRFTEVMRKAAKAEIDHQLGVGAMQHGVTV